MLRGYFLRFVFVAIMALAYGCLAFARRLASTRRRLASFLAAGCVVLLFGGLALSVWVTPAGAGTVRVEAESVLTSTWMTTSSGSASGGVHANASAGSGRVLFLAVVGPAEVDVAGLTQNATISFRWRIDTGEWTTVSQSGGSTVYQDVQATIEVPSGEHTIRFEPVVSTTYLDFFDVRTEDPPPTTTTTTEATTTTTEASTTTSSSTTDPVTTTAPPPPPSSSPDELSADGRAATYTGAVVAFLLAALVVATTFRKGG